MRKRILLVDDSATLRRMVEQLLQAHGFDVVSCNSAVQAVAAATGEIDVVVTDLNMPDMDGIALTRKLRSTAAVAACPILILSTESSESRKQDARLAGASGWVLKPFQVETLVKAIHRVCDKTGAHV